MEPASPLRARLEEIEHCVESGAELSAGILGFAQGGQYNPVPTDLNGLVQASLEMFGRTRKEIEVHAVTPGIWHGGDRPGAARAGAAQPLRQRRAGDARGRQLFVETRERVL